jgi:hypothetical protein
MNPMKPSSKQRPLMFLFVLFVLFTALLLYYCSSMYRKEHFIGILPPKKNMKWLDENTKWVARAQAPSTLPGVDKIYAIVLPKRKDSFIETMKDIGLGNNVDVLDAFHKDNIGYFFPYMGGAYSLKINRGRVACNISHAMILNDFLKSDAQTALIFEDDLRKVEPGSMDRFKEFLIKMQQKNWDLLHPGFDAERVGPNETIKKGFFRAYTPFQAHAYIVNRKSAKMLLDRIFPATEAIDSVIVEYTNNNTLVSYAINPPIFLQNRDTITSELGNFQPITTFLPGTVNRNRDQE